MKKHLLNIISAFIIFLFGLSTMAYETVVVDFPIKEGWHSVYYGVLNKEAILQYVPAGQTAKKWTRSVIFHAYKSDRIEKDAARFMDTTTSQMEVQNPTAAYRYVKHMPEDSIATRCTKSIKNVPAQCEIYRIMISHEGIMTMHYINRNQKNYLATYNQWFQIMRNIRIYYSYYRTDRVLDKATFFEM